MLVSIVTVCVISQAVVPGFCVSQTSPNLQDKRSAGLGLILKRRDDSSQKKEIYESERTGAQVNLVTQPELIAEGISQSLEVKCRTRASGPVMSISIGKKAETGMCGLAYITTSKEIVKMDDELHGDVRGNLDADGKGGELTIVLKEPTRNNAGVYECVVSTMEGFGVMTTEKKSAHVDTRLITAEDLLSRILLSESKLRNEMDDLRSALSVLQTAFFTVSGEYKGRRYHLTEYNSMTYLKAQEVCEALGGYLAEINDQEEYVFVHGFVSPRVSQSATILLSGTDSKHEGRWVFQRTGKPVTVLDWTPGEPNDCKGGEDCLSFFYSGGKVGMNDMKCHSGLREWTITHGFLCEVETLTKEE